MIRKSSNCIGCEMALSVTQDRPQCSKSTSKCKLGHLHLENIYYFSQENCMTRVLVWL